MVRLFHVLIILLLVSTLHVWLEILCLGWLYSQMFSSGLFCEVIYNTYVAK